MTEVVRLTLAGYCRVSNKYRTVSRIDRPDWKEYMAKQHCPWDVTEGMEWVELLARQGDAEDFYRRVYSRDKVTVSEETFYALPRSGESVLGYREKGGDDGR
jgi:hypothetical protein